MELTEKMKEFINDLIGKRMEEVYQEKDGEQYDPFLAVGYALGENGLLCRRVLDAVALVDDDGLEEIDVLGEDDVLQSEALAVGVVDEELAQGLVVDNRDLVHAHAQEIGPCGAVGVVEDERLLVGELLELSLPVDLERGGAYDEAWVGRGRVDNANGL